MDLCSNNTYILFNKILKPLSYHKIEYKSNNNEYIVHQNTT